MTRPKRFPRFVSITAALMLCGCAVGPNYQRTEVDSPARFRSQTGKATNESLASLPWWKLFRDPALQSLISEGLANNYDLKIAVTRIEQARAIQRQVAADFFPQFGHGFSAERSRSPERDVETALGTASVGGVTSNLFTGTLSSAWEIDLWGRIRRLNQAAVAQLLATEEARRGVVQSLVTSIAQFYFQLRELDLELEIAKRTAESFKDSLVLFQNQRDAGLASDLEVERANASYKGTSATIPDIERAIAITENQICVLLGRNPSSIKRGRTLVAQYDPPRVPAGIPSALLERRPDILQSEQAVVAANAQIGVAIANFLPRVGLTAAYGRSSDELHMLLDGRTHLWNIAADVSGPIFQGGRLFGILRQSQAAWEESKLQYESTALNAFREVSDSLVARQKYTGVIAETKVQVTSLEAAVKLARDRYTMGITSYFELLQAQQELFPAEINLARARLAYLLALVDLYKALGGGWFDSEVPQPAAK